MSYLPLPPFLTLDEAAHAIGERLGQQWTARHVLGCATEGKINVFARIGHAVRLVRVEPIEGEQNEIHGEHGSLPRLSAKAVNALLLAGAADFDELTYPRTVDFFGEPVETMVTVWKLAPGETAPEIRPEDCRVLSAGVLQLVDKYTQQADPDTQATTPSPAPVELVLPDGASDGMCDVDTAPANPMQRTAAQDVAILGEIEKQGYDPQALPKNPPGKPGAKAAIRTALTKNSLFTGGTVFDKAWERLTARGDIVIQG